ncbi:MAG: hypothetical protein LBE62_00520 [Azonexus sp.]|jgi:hypothetical protein|nr:hypothetical protein [Azonexus sp.]
MRIPLAALSIASILAGCATTMPNGPSKVMLPPPAKPLEVFTAEDKECRQYAEQAVSGQVGKFSLPAMTIGTSVGAIGGSRGSVSGGGIGVGTEVGGDSAEADIQRNYDAAYLQCMYAKGNQ